MFEDKGHHMLHTPVNRRTEWLGKKRTMRGSNTLVYKLIVQSFTDILCELLYRSAVILMLSLTLSGETCTVYLYQT